LSPQQRQPAALRRAAMRHQHAGSVEIWFAEPDQIDLDGGGLPDVRARNPAADGRPRRQ